jgi:hypothetical protein
MTLGETGFLTMPLQHYWTACGSQSEAANYFLRKASLDAGATGAARSQEPRYISLWLWYWLFFMVVVAS